MAGTILNYLIFFVLSALLTVASSVLLPKLSSWLAGKTENERLKAVISDITTTVQTAVDEIEQTTVSKLKQEGRWDTETQKEALKAALEKVLSGLLTSTKDTLEKSGVNINDLIIRHIEAYIQKEKRIYD